MTAKENFTITGLHNLTDKGLWCKQIYSATFRMGVMIIIQIFFGVKGGWGWKGTVILVLISCQKKKKITNIYFLTQFYLNSKLIS